MDKFDEYLEKNIDNENKDFILPKSFEDKLEETLGNLGEISEGNNKRWYENKRIWATAACFAFVCLAGISMRNELSDNKNNPSIRSAENQVTEYSEGAPEMASDYSGELKNSAEKYSSESRADEFSLNDQLTDTFIDSSSINKLTIKSIKDNNKYKAISKREDIEKVINFINDISREKTESQSINDWDFLIQTSGVDSNHSIILQGNIMNIDESWFKIDSQDIEKLKDMYNDLNYKEENIPYCDY